MGMLIMPQDQVPAEDGLTRTVAKVKNIPRTIWQDDIFTHAEGYKVMTGVLTGIPSDNYLRALAGRGYITFGSETIYTGETNVRSLAQVPYLARSDKTTGTAASSSQHPSGSTTESVTSPTTTSTANVPVTTNSRDNGWTPND